MALIGMAEEWKDIPNYEGYQASTLGRIRCCRGKGRAGITSVWKVRATNKKTPYEQLCLYLYGKRYSCLVHRLVLETFIGPCPEGLECRHLDGNKHNNVLSNLCWGTPVENAADTRRHGKLLFGEKHPNSKLTDTQINEIRAKAKRGNRPVLATAYNVSISLINRILQNRHRVVN